MNKLWQMRYLVFFVCCEECFKLTVPTKKIIHVITLKNKNHFPTRFHIHFHKQHLLQTCFENSANRFRGERILFFGPNTNTNNIRNQILDRIRIRIIFVFSEWANTNDIPAQIFGRIRIRIIFGFRIVPEYEYK